MTKLVGCFDGELPSSQETKKIFSNKLSPAEAERLALLAEECGEIVQAVCKILRHGYENFDPVDPLRKTNRKLLALECGHAQARIIQMIEARDISSNLIEFSIEDKLSGARYLHHQQKTTGPYDSSSS